MWVDASANRVATAYASTPLCTRRRHGKTHSGGVTLTKRRTLGVSLSRKGAFCVWAPPKGAFCMRAVVAPRAHLRRSVYTPASPRLPAAAQQCTQMPRNGSESPSSPICVHSCVPTSARNGVTVYTSAPRRRREAIFADLCTLLHTHGRSQRRNSVHKCPGTAPRARFRRSVYTPAYPRPLAAAGRGARRVPTTARLPFRESLLRPHQAQSVLSQWVSLSCG